MRADKFFAEKFGSRSKAAAALKQGLILRNGKPLAPDDEVREGDGFSATGELRYVSAGGYKLESGLDAFGERVMGGVYADLGASTGGFTDCLLQRGAKKVFCVDVGESQLAPALFSDPRVAVMDRTNARYLTARDFPCPLDGVVADLSFISLRLILPAVKELLPAGGKAFVLFKPQFECGRKALGKSGVCPPALHGGLLADFYDFCLPLSLAPRAVVPAPVREKKNVEYMVFLQKDAPAAEKTAFLSIFKK